MDSFFSPPAKKLKYFFVPSNPAANGRLHLGHISGPYLMADILARHRKREGHDVTTIFGIDAYNSYVMRNAQLEHKTPEEIATGNYKLIQKDLQALGIHYDTFTNPLDERWSQQYEEEHDQAFQTLWNNQVIKICSEESPYSEQEEVFKPDCLISGTCPDCGAGMGGFACEACGGYFYPDSILEQTSEKGEAMSFRSVENLCLDSDTVPLSVEDFSDYHLSSDATSIISTHLEKRNGWFKLTHHFDWGLKTKFDGKQRAITSFMTEYVYNLMHGRLYAKLNDAETPYALQSDVRIICSIGIDNVIAQVFGKKMLSKALGNTRPDDAFLINYFLNLEGEKFSTSRKHAIWASDIITQTPAHSDGVRLYLALNAPVEPNRNFDIQAFLDLYNTALVDKLNNLLDHCIGLAKEYTGAQLDQDIAQVISDLYQQQTIVLDDHQVNPEIIAKTILVWLDHPAGQKDQADSAYWWLKGLSLLACPVMPTLSAAIWQYLTGEDMPSLGSFIGHDSGEKFTDAGSIPRFQSLSYDNVASCLPDSVKNH